MIYISNYIIPTIILIVIIFGMLEKIEIFNTFCDGAKEGLKIAVMMFPTLLGVFICIGMLKNSGIIEKSVNLLRPLSLLFCIPTMATDLMVKYGVDSKIGMLAATIMSSSETTFYVIALYLNSVHIKNNRNIFIPAIIADLVSIIVSLLIIK